MKMKTTMTITLILISFLSIGQSYPNDDNAISVDNNEIQQKEKPTAKDQKNIALKEKKWKKTKKQILRNKKRFSSHKNTVHSSKIIDTIYIDIPASINNSRLSEW